MNIRTFLLKITLNGKAIQTTTQTIAALCQEQGYGEAKIATALNGNFVPQTQRDKTPLKEQDSVEIVAPRQGG